MIGDRRAPDAPPCDALAESLVLYHVLFIHPHHIDAVDLAPLLVFPEHRAAWRVAMRVRMRQPALDDGGLFYVEWLKELWDTESSANNILDLLVAAHATEDQRVDQEWRSSIDTPHERPRSQFYRGFEQWLARLESVAEARRGIRAAQQIAEHYWRMPDRPFSSSDAVRIIEKSVPLRTGVIRVDIE